MDLNLCEFQLSGKKKVILNDHHTNRVFLLSSYLLIGIQMDSETAESQKQILIFDALYKLNDEQQLPTWFSISKNILSGQLANKAANEYNEISTSNSKISEEEKVGKKFKIFKQKSNKKKSRSLMHYFRFEKRKIQKNTFLDTFKIVQSYQAKNHNRNALVFNTPQVTSINPCLSKESTTKFDTSSALNEKDQQIRRKSCECSQCGKLSSMQSKTKFIKGAIKFWERNPIIIKIQNREVIHKNKTQLTLVHKDGTIKNQQSYTQQSQPATAKLLNDLTDNFNFGSGQMISNVSTLVQRSKVSQSLKLLIVQNGCWGVKQRPKKVLRLIFKRQQIRSAPFENKAKQVYLIMLLPESITTEGLFQKMQPMSNHQSCKSKQFPCQLQKERQSSMIVINENLLQDIYQPLQSPNQITLH